MSWDERTREERHHDNTCSICSIWLASDEPLLAVEDYKEFIDRLFLYRNRDERDALWAEWRRRHLSRST